MTDPVLVEWFNEHWYKVVENEETIFIPSVTTKLGIVDKPNLARWRGDLGNREADLRMYDAGQRGKRIHFALQTLLTGGAVIYNPWNHPLYSTDALAKMEAEFEGNLMVLHTQDEMVQIVKLQRQLKLLDPKILSVEQTVYDLNNLDAGTIDHVYEIKEGDYEIAGRTPLYLKAGIYVGDLKTGNYIDDNVWMQLAAYTVMLELRNNITVQGALVTHTSAKTKTGIAGLTTLFRDRLTLIEKDYKDYRHASALWERDHKEDKPEQYEFPSLITLGG